MHTVNRFFGIIIPIVILLQSCDPPPWYKNKFYNNAIVGKFKRLPLNKPFELYKEKDKSGWEILFMGDHPAGAYIDEIYVKKGQLITGIGNRGYMLVGNDTVPNRVYFIINFKNWKHDFYYKEERFDSALQSNAVNRKDLLDAKQLDSVYNKYAATGALPWYSE